ncbi:Hypothetical predicted protein [Octopus vulgaris]|uniref:Uncharacterized protein n=1 Tax=Octopus vulgaris TaxID=6645 RepID=A0AA36B523_OCTVU|nr:Hypothetical predicted protein [Octopus vulgaris]
MTILAERIRTVHEMINCGGGGGGGAAGVGGCATNAQNDFVLNIAAKVVTIAVIVLDFVQMLSNRFGSGVVFPATSLQKTVRRRY